MVDIRHLLLVPQAIEEVYTTPPKPLQVRMFVCVSQFGEKEMTGEGLAGQETWVDEKLGRNDAFGR